MTTIPVISSYVLKGLPAFVRQEIGEVALQRANRAGRFDAEMIEGKNYFIPQLAVLEFANTIARAAGEPNFGLLIAPSMDASSYGNFGRYVFGADTLGHAIARSIATLCYHSTFDKLSLTALGEHMRYGWTCASANSEGYPTVACAAAGEMLSLFKAYLPASWRPVCIELNIETPHQISLFEDTFQCPVHFNASAVAIVFERRHLMATSTRTSQPMVTIEDVVRDWPDGAPRSLLAVTIEQIRTQVFIGSVSIDDIAWSMDTSVRTLQRELNRAGTDFRSLTSVVRIQRATELLRQTGSSITHISAELGYSSPAHFTRAFRKMTGVGPREFRASKQHGD
ncbi:AraC family transcriptional regulator ligand-binding domain-containing protein [Xanthobacter autotrophicus DSM 431]|uniref:AraC family transcriptional regulator ligand-binding domain-containing protein n=1 Tax=Xanthobacter nonsaccharivorans TaxID=3119912 RepID=UPI00372C8FC5